MHILVRDREATEGWTKHVETVQKMQQHLKTAEGLGAHGLLLISLPECSNLRGKIKVKELFLTILLRGALGSGRRGFSAPPAACHTIQDKHLLLFH